MDPSVGREPYAQPDQSSGLALIELLIVVSVVGLVLLAAVLPGLFRTRPHHNEASAAGALKTIAAAQTDYKHSSQPSYASTLEQLRSGAGSGGVRYIDDSIGTGMKAGYRFTLVAGAETGGAYYAWSAEAHPVVYRRTGVRSFYIDQTGILLGNDVGGVRGNSTMPEI